MTNEPRIIERNALNRLLEVLVQEGYQIVGPTLGEGAIVYGPVQSSEDFPAGWTDEQEGGVYRLKKRADKALFGYVVGPHSWKKYLHPPERRLWTGQANGTDFELTPEPIESTRFAFFGVRSCELHAIEIQDRVFIHDDHVDEDYKARRENAFVVVVQCGQAGKTCFCVSMNTGPKAESGYDLALTEILDEGRHFFHAVAGSPKGAAILQQVEARAATSSDNAEAEETVQKASQQMGRTLDTAGVKELLQENAEHPRWDLVADRCLSCANCTMVCPTCFCSTVEDTTDLTGDHTERWQKWDSCFTMDFSYLHGGSVRASTKSRYRQWLTHKLSSWIDQFGSSGCVGCGRCVTWCPVGIDLTEEVRSIREDKLVPLSSKKEASNGNA